MTVARGGGDEHHARAASLAARFVSAGVAVAGVDDVGGDQARYVVGPEREAIVTDGASPCFVGLGLFRTKVGEGRWHPLIRAVLGASDAVHTVLDLTCGLAGDALHVAGALGVDVDANEGSVVVHALLEDGLMRLRKNQSAGAAAGRVRLAPQARSARDALGARRDASVDVVMLDPMLRGPQKAQPQFEALRSFTMNELPDVSLVEEAKRVARVRVIWKVGRFHRPVVDYDAVGLTRVELGTRVAYRVWDRP